MSRHTGWKTELLWTVDKITEALRAPEATYTLRKAVTELETHIGRLKRMLTSLEAMECAIRTYHSSRPGNLHDRIDMEIEADCEHFRNRSHPRWRLEDYREMQTVYDRFMAMSNGETPPPG